MYKQTILSFSRNMLLNRVTKPQMSIALYPKNTSATTLSVNVTSTDVVLKYVSSSTTTHTISYVGKSISNLCAEINSKNIPVLAIPLNSNNILASGDLITTNGFKKIPDEFSIYNRTTTDNGAIIRSIKYTVKNKSDISIKLLKPYNDNSFLPWYPRLSVGSFAQTINSRNYIYSIPEYSTQVWSSRYGKPFIDIEGTSPIFIDESTIQLPRYPIFWDGANILMFNGDTPLTQNLVKDVDINNGIIFLEKGNYFNKENLTINYTYLEKSYTYKHININGHFSQNPFILNKYVVIYLLPNEASNTTPQKRNVYHVVADSLEEGIDNISKNYVNSPYAVIGAYSIQNTYNSEELTILDTRVLGGGIIKSSGPKPAGHQLLDIDEKENQEIEDFYIESRNYYDIGRVDGEVYPGAAAIDIDLPDTLRDSIPERDIIERATKFVAAGIYPLINFSKRDVPLVTGTCSQISALINNDFSSSITGAGWIAPYTVPNNTAYTYFEENELGIFYNTSTGLSSNYITVDSTGYYQYYLKSSPDALVTWEEREVYDRTGQKEPVTYSSWIGKQLVDKTDVAVNTLVKNTLEFPKIECIKQYRNVQVYSPYRLDNITGFKQEILNSIREISGSYSGIASLEPGLSYNQIRYYVKDIINEERDYVEDYFGISIAHNYLFDLVNTSAGNDFTGMLNSVGTYFLSGITSGTFKLYSPSVDEYYLPLEYTEIDISMPLYQLGRYTHYLKDTYGTGNINYIAAAANLTGVLRRLEVRNNRVLKDYIFTPETTGQDGTPILSTGINYSLPESNGYAAAEVNETYNKDYTFLNIVPSLSAAIIAQPSLSSINTSTFPYTFFTGMCSTIAAEMARMPSASHAARSYNNLSVSDSWYITYNRYSKYLANYLDNLTQTYDIMYPVFTGEYAGTFTTYNGSNALGNNTPTLDLIYTAIYSGLYLNQSRVLESIVRNGVVDSGIAKVIQAFGWFANNSQTHCQKYNKTVPTGFISTCSGVYYSGMLSLIKDTVGLDGNLHETTYVDGEKGPFISKTPALVFNALSEGCALNSTFYKPFAQGLYNTLTGLYNMSGVYWEDSIKQYYHTTRNFDIVYSFTKLWNKI